MPVGFCVEIPTPVPPQASFGMGCTSIAPRPPLTTVNFANGGTPKFGGLAVKYKPGDCCSYCQSTSLWLISKPQLVCSDIMPLKYCCEL